MDIDEAQRILGEWREEFGRSTAGPIPGRRLRGLRPDTLAVHVDQIRVYAPYATPPITKWTSFRGARHGMSNV
jgi:hypothetical protein